MLRVDSFYDDFDDDYFKLINVRHPFDRILSAYHHFTRKVPGTLRGPGLIQLKYISKLFNTTHTRVTLEQFLQFLVSPAHLHSAVIYHDRHWDSYARSCKVCSVGYEYILRTETSLTDSQPVLTRFDYPADYLATFKPQNQNPNQRKERAPPDEATDDITAQYDEHSIRSMNSFEKQLPEFSEINKVLLSRLYDKYRFDFEAFGYHFDFDTNLASCAIETSTGQVCC